MKATAIANSNIAFVKYWGKKDESLNIPFNPSISMTLDEKISTKTTVEFSEKYESDILILNNEKLSDNKLIRVSNFLDMIRKKSGCIYHAKVISKNTFPTGCGIASSASGFAALAAAAARASGLNLKDEELSKLARMGSGSAARSVYGGFAIWDNESATQIKDETFWPELTDIIAITDDQQKKISSREAMKITVKTSKKYRERLQKVDEKTSLMKQSILAKDFPNMAKLIMSESDNLHECMHDSVPEIEYLNENSYRIKELINEMNKEKPIAAYTFDAGPNAHIITLKKHSSKIKKELLKIFGLRLIESKIGKGIRYTEEHMI